jgi:hypothetical protein
MAALQQEGTIDRHVVRPTPRLFAGLMQYMLYGMPRQAS